MRSTPLVFLVSAAALVLAADRAPRDRPATWATPVIDTRLENCFRVSSELLRSEQPDRKGIPDLRALGVRTILNLRRHHEDPEEFERAGFVLIAQPLEADDVSVDDLVAALRRFRDAPKPVLVHCWHGSDRTGAFVAAYRIAFQGWSREAALDELRGGGFGYHEKWYPNLVALMASIDEAELRRRVRE